MVKCPRCGTRQATDAVRLCSPCGMQMDTPLGGPRPAGRACLMCHGDWPVGRTLVLGRREIRIGRRRGDNDIVLRVLPRSGVHDTMSLQITGSRPHLVLSLRSEGLFLADQKTTNGTLLDGRPVVGRAPLPLDRPCEVEVARALRLRFVPFLSADDEAGSAWHESIYAGISDGDELWRHAEQIGLRSVLIQRMANLEVDEQYLIVYRWANCGSGPDNELILPEAPVAGTNWRIVRRGGGLWVQSLVDGGDLMVGGVGLDRGLTVAMTAGMELVCGPASARVTGFQQFGL